MLGLIGKTLTTNLKYVAVGIGSVAVFGGAATTALTLNGSTTPTPTPHGSSTAKPSTDADDAQEKADDAAEKAGTRPTNTHGYCVSTKVAAAKAAGKTGRDIAAAAHSCASPGKSAGAHAKSSKAPRS